jgi:tetratricopeptide (TPR) repeat protein
MNQVKESINQEEWEEAKAPLEKLIRLFPEQTGSDNAYALLARVHRQLNETDRERKVLSQWAAQSDEASSAYLRLMELGIEAEDWAAVRENAERFLAVNPLLPQPHRFLARASEALEQTEEAIVSYRKLLKLDPANPAMVHYRLANLLHRSGGESAKRHVLQALEQAPRFRDAHRLLLDIHETGAKPIQESKPNPEMKSSP